MLAFSKVFSVRMVGCLNSLEFQWATVDIVSAARSLLVFLQLFVTLWFNSSTIIIYFHTFPNRSIIGTELFISKHPKKNCSKRTDFQLF